MKTVKYELCGQTLHLRLTSAALYDIYDAYQPESSFDPISAGGRQGFEAVCWYLQKLAEQGELTRRWEGFEPSEIPTVDQLRLLMTPADLPRAKLVLIRAMNMGFGREIEDDEPVDLGLVEFEKKKRNRRTVTGAVLPRGCAVSAAPAGGRPASDAGRDQ